jgi:DNA-binding response OmpR family regulator
MKKKVLVVDNHKVVLKFMASLLEKEGHQVLTAEDGLLALDILKTYVPDIVFIDLVGNLRTYPRGTNSLCQPIVHVTNRHQRGKVIGVRFHRVF